MARSYGASSRRAWTADAAGIPLLPASRRCAARANLTRAAQKGERAPRRGGSERGGPAARGDRALQRAAARRHLHADVGRGERAARPAWQSAAVLGAAVADALVEVAGAGEHRLDLG